MLTRNQRTKSPFVDGAVVAARVTVVLMQLPLTNTDNVAPKCDLGAQCSAHKCTHTNTHDRIEQTERSNERKRHSCVTNETSDSNMKRLHFGRDGFIKAINTFWDSVVTLAHFRHFQLIFGENEKEGYVRPRCIDKQKHWQECTSSMSVRVCLIYSDARMSATACCMLPVLCVRFSFFIVVFSCSQNGKSIYRQCFVSFVHVCRNSTKQPTANESLCRFLLSLFFYLKK